VGTGDHLTRQECRAIHAQIHDDIDNQRLVRTSLDLDRVFVEACELSRLYTSKVLSRTLDLLHVAAARVVTCTTFISADDRQLAVAKATGLAVIDIKRRRSSPTSFPIARPQSKPKRSPVC